MAIWREKLSSRRVGWLAAGSVALILPFSFLVTNRLAVLQPSPMAAARAAEGLQPRKVTLSGRDLDVRVVLRSLAAQVGSRLVLDEAVHGKLSIDARDADFTDLMENLCTAFRCKWNLDQSPTPTLRVTRQSDS